MVHGEMASSVPARPTAISAPPRPDSRLVSWRTDAPLQQTGIVCRSEDTAEAMATGHDLMRVLCGSRGVTVWLACSTVTAALPRCRTRPHYLLPYHCLTPTIRAPTPHHTHTPHLFIDLHLAWALIEGGTSCV